ncbi:MAG: pyrroline-5-carboxylate reductase [Pseudomonadota bacterium]
MMKVEDKVGFVGGGNMAEALIKGLVQSGKVKPENMLVFDPDQSRLKYLSQTYQVGLAENNASLVNASRVILLAVKPEVVDKVLQEIGSIVSDQQLIISIAAGVPLKRLQAAVAAPCPVIRVMPNTPALTQSGAAAIARGALATDEHAAQARDIFEAVGLAVEVDEKYMDVVTGLSGSGPAYVFLMLEAMIEGAVRLGLPRSQAHILAAQTIMGAAKMALSAERHPAELKNMVTSPGGTTAAGLHTLEKGGFRYLVMEAVAAAARRSAELGRE